MGDRPWNATFKEDDWGTPADDRFSRTASPLRADSKDTPSKADMSFGQTAAQSRRASRRSSDILNATKQLDDEARTRREFDTIRETKSAMITTDDIGAVASVNEYTILRELGKGSFAEVKLCKKTSSLMSSPSGSIDERAEEKMTAITAEDGGEDPGNQLYAIKIFSKSLLLRRKSYMRNGEGRMAVTTDLDKVQKEIAIMKKLIHPNLVRLYEVIDDPMQDALYIVLEYVTGGAIMDYDHEERKYVYRKSRRGVMSEVHAARCIVDVMAGLVYLHLHHICHRDLKPENVLVDSRGRCKIADFGVAHYFEEEEAKGQTELSHLYRTHSRGLLKNTDGTWCFWAPEMCRAGGPFSGYSCDIWAAGVCLWVFMYGTLPFMEDSPDDLFDKIVEGDLEFPERNVSPDLVDLLEQLLRKSPTDRITLEDALDHSWCQLADEDPDAADMSSTLNESQLQAPMGRSLRARATSFSRVYVTQDDINSAIRTVNNFVLVTKLKKRLTQKLQEARASLSRRSPVTTPDGSRANTPVTGGSRASTPLTNIFEKARSLSGSPAKLEPKQQQGGSSGSGGSSSSLDKPAPTACGEKDLDSSEHTPGATPSTMTATPTTGASVRSTRGLRKRQSCAVM